MHQLPSPTAQAGCSSKNAHLTTRDIKWVTTPTSLCSPRLTTCANSLAATTKASTIRPNQVSTACASPVRHTYQPAPHNRRKPHQQCTAQLPGHSSPPATPQPGTPPQPHRPLRSASTKDAAFSARKRHVRQNSQEASPGGTVGCAHPRKATERSPRGGRKGVGGSVGGEDFT
jgi:hypothetical protein